MTTEEARALIAAGREHDEVVRADVIRTRPLTAMVAWMRINLRALLDGYAAALVRIEALEKFCGIAGLMVDDIATERDAAKSEVEQLLTLVQALRFDTDERERLADEVERLRIECNDSADRDAELYQLRTEVLRLTETARTAAENWMAACRQRDEARAEADRQAKVQAVTQANLDNFMGACADQTIQIMELRGELMRLRK